MAVAAAGNRAVKDAVIGSELLGCVKIGIQRRSQTDHGAAARTFWRVCRVQAWYIENSRSDALMPMQTPQNIQR